MSRRYLIVAAVLVVAGLGLVVSGFTGSNNTETPTSNEVDTSSTAKEETPGATEATQPAAEGEESGSVAAATTDETSMAGAVRAPSMANTVSATPAAQPAQSTVTPTTPSNPGTGNSGQPQQPVITASAQVTSPAAGALIAGTVSVQASATATEQIAYVQFILNGANTIKDTAAPYSYAFDTKTVANGAYTIGATVVTVSGVSATASPVAVTVSNTVVTPPVTANLVVNPSVENETNGQPTGWSQGVYGTNTSTFTYENTGRTGSRSLTVTTTARTDGDAKWGSTAFAVTPGATYQVSDYYKATTDTQVEVEFTIAGQQGTSFQYIGAAPAAADWTNFKGQFTAPAGATSAVVYHILANVGTLTTDDYSVEAYTPTSFNRGMVSLTFDDGWKNIHTYGLPLLQQYGMVSTQYLNSQPIEQGFGGYMTPADVQSFLAAGHEIASHTATHANLTTLTAEQIATELETCNAYLAAITSNQATRNFASPFGAYNATVLAEVQKYNTSHRSVETGFNSKDNFNLYNIKVQNIVANTTQTQIEAWVNEAIATKTWLVLVYHQVSPTIPADAVGLPATDQYWTTPADLEAALSFIKNSGVTVSTVKDALAEVQAQL